MEATQETLFEMPEAASQAMPSTPLGRFKLYFEHSEKQGGLIPQNILPDILGLSQQRVSQLVKAGRFTTYSLFGQKFVTGESFAAFVEMERSTGTRYKAPSFLKLAKAHLPSMSNMLSGK